VAKIAVTKAVGAADTSVQESLIRDCSALLAETKKAIDELERELDKASKKKTQAARARACRDKVVPAMQALREPVDELEVLVDKEKWPMPSYGDLMF